MTPPITHGSPRPVPLPGLQILAPIHPVTVRRDPLIRAAEAIERRGWRFGLLDVHRTAQLFVAALVAVLQARITEEGHMP